LPICITGGRDAAACRRQAQVTVGESLYAYCLQQY